MHEAKNNSYFLPNTSTIRHVYNLFLNWKKKLKKKDQGRRRTRQESSIRVDFRINRQWDVKWIFFNFSWKQRHIRLIHSILEINKYLKCETNILYSGAMVGAIH